MLIDQEFKMLIPSLTKEEYEGLEKSLLTEGCRDNLTIWKETDILLDGHNRYEICQKHNLIFQIKYISLSDRSLAEEWIVTNQLNRRNITTYQRVELRLKLESIWKEKAKENQGTRTDLLLNSAKGSESINTREELAKAAGVSPDTIYKVKSIHEHGIGPLQDMARSGEISINAAAAIAKASEEEQKAIVELPEKEIIAKAQELAAQYKAEINVAKAESVRKDQLLKFRQQVLFDQENIIKDQTIKLQHQEQRIEDERSILAKEKGHFILSKSADDQCIIRQEALVEKLNQQIEELKAQVAQPQVITQEVRVEVEKRIEVIPEDYDVLKIEVNTLKENLQTIKQESGEELSEYQSKIDKLTSKLAKKEKLLDSFDDEQKQINGLQKLTDGMKYIQESNILLRDQQLDQYTKEIVNNLLESIVRFSNNFFNQD